jgi:hypothetical protein
MPFSRLPLAVALSLAATAADAGSMRSEGENEVVLGLKLDYGDRFWNRQGDRVDTGCAGSQVMPAGYERGLSYYHTAFVKSGIKRSRCGNSGTRLEDVEIGLRGRLDPLSDKHLWEVSLFLPASRWSGAGLDRESGSVGLNAGIHVNALSDPYSTFLDPASHRQGRFGYGAGFRLWEAHVPAHVWAYAAWSKLLADADWQHDHGGWWFYARVDAKHSLLREHRTHLDDGLDIHDRYWQVSASAYFSHQIKPWQVLTFGLRQDLAGRNVTDGSGIAAYYTWNWRN